MPAVDNPWARGIQTIGSALFDPADAAKERTSRAQVGLLEAKTEKERAETQGITGSNDAYNNLGTALSGLVNNPDTLRAVVGIAQSARGKNPAQVADMLRQLVGTQLVQEGGEGNMRSAATLFGRQPGVNTAFTESTQDKLLTQRRQQAVDVAEIGADSRVDGATVNAGARVKAAEIGAEAKKAGDLFRATTGPASAQAPKPYKPGDLKRVEADMGILSSEIDRRFGIQRGDGGKQTSGPPPPPPAVKDAIANRAMEYLRAGEPGMAEATYKAVMDVLGSTDLGDKSRFAQKDPLGSGNASSAPKAPIPRLAPVAPPTAPQATAAPPAAAAQPANVIVLGPDGRRYQIPAQNLQAALARGARLAQ